MAERTKGREVDLTDGIKVFEQGGWAQVLPDPDDAVVHVYAEGKTDEEAGALAERFVALVEDAVSGAAEEGVGEEALTLK